MQHASYFNQFLIDHVNIDDGRLDKLGARVDAVYNALVADPVIGEIVLGKSKQGSWAHRLIIRPTSGGEFDADFLLEMASSRLGARSVLG